MSVELQNPEPPDYWRESSRPLVSLVFIAPMLVAYELGMIALGPAAVRNGAEVWLRRFLDAIGFGQYFLLPVLTCGLLLGWHHVLHSSWRFRPSVLGGMTLESAIVAFGLLALAQIPSTFHQDFNEHRVANSQLSFTTRVVEEPHDDMLQSLGGVLGYLGAGIYEELLFRLTLLPLAVLALRSIGTAPRAAWAFAIVSVSVLFSLAHYQWDLNVFGIALRTSGYEFDWFSFTFRCLAGMAFSLLFVSRGFGIVVGAHALYDIFAVLL